MKIVIFTHDSKSHIIGIRSFIKSLSEIHDVHVFINKNFSNLLNFHRIHIHNYDERINIETTELYKQYSKKIGGIGLTRKLDSFNDFIDESTEPYKYLLKGNKIYIKYLLNVTKLLNPDLIIRDCCSLFGRIIADTLDIPVYGYNTAGTMSNSYLTRNLRENLSDIYNWNLQQFTDTEVSELFKKISCKFEEISKENSIRSFPINYLINPDEEKNICFSIPWYSYGDERYINIQPDVFNSSKDINFEKENRIFISSGTVMVFTAPIYNYLINSFKNKNYSVKIAFKYLGENFIKLNNIPPNITFEQFSNQKDELKKSKCFVNHGGYNSILESIYYETPLLLIPLNSDQFFNSRMIEINNLGFRIDKNNINTEKIDNYFNELEKNNIYINSIKEMKKKTLELPTSEEYISNNIISI